MPKEPVNGLKEAVSLILTVHVLIMQLVLHIAISGNMYPKK